MDSFKVGMLTALVFIGANYSEESLATDLPQYTTVAGANIGFSLSNISNIGAPSSIAQSISTTNPYYGNLGEPSGFPNLAGATSGVTGGPLNTLTPFAYAYAFSSSPEVNAGALIQYAFKIVSDNQSSIPINIHSIVSQSIGYQALGLNTDPTIYYGYFGQNSNSTVSLQIQPFGFGSITTLQRICSQTLSNCSGVSGQPVVWDNQYSFQTNSLYFITLSAGAYGLAPPLLGNIATGTFAISYIDPYFEIDSSVPDKEQYLLQFSAGVQNIVPTTGVPEPTSWMMMIVGFGILGRAMRRHPSVFVRFQSA
jgi:hypothetical protein